MSIEILPAEILVVHILSNLTKIKDQLYFLMTCKRFYQLFEYINTYEPVRYKTVRNHKYLKAFKFILVKELDDLPNLCFEKFPAHIEVLKFDDEFNMSLTLYKKINNEDVKSGENILPDNLRRLIIGRKFDKKIEYPLPSTTIWTTIGRHNWIGDFKLD